MTTVDLSILNTTIDAFINIAAYIVTRIDVLVGLALLGIIIGAATKMGKALGGLFDKIFKPGTK